MSRSRPFWIAFVLLAIAAAVPLLVTYRLPMIDLPQHAAQITIWKHYDDPCYGFSRTYEKNWFTPYLIGYAVTRVFATVMPVNAALKLTIWLAIVALPLTMRMIATRANIDEWLTLPGFPLAFGYSFYWGFLNNVVAVPIAIVYVVWAYDYAREPRFRRALQLVVLALLVTAGHVIIFAGAALAAGILHLRLWRTPVRMVLTVWPHFVPLPLLFLWTQRITDNWVIREGWTLWLTLWSRPMRLFSDLLAHERSTAAMLMSVALIVVATLAGLRPSRNKLQWIPALVFGALYFAAPDTLQGVAFIHGRFAVFFAVFLLFAMERGRSPVSPRIARALIVVSVLVWMSILAMRFHAFGREAEEFDALVDHLEPNRSMVALIFDRASAYAGRDAYLQWPAYYQERKGGLINWSFANGFPVLIRYRPGAEIRTTRMLYAEPRVFRWGTNDSRYEYFVLRAPDASFGRFAFREAGEPVVLRGRFGKWWLYQRARPLAPAPRCRPFTPDDPASRGDSR